MAHIRWQSELNSKTLFIKHINSSKVVNTDISYSK